MRLARPPLPRLPGNRGAAPAHRLQIVSAALLFSTGGAAIKACSMTGWQVACCRSAIAAVFLWVVVPRWRRFWSPRSALVGLAYAATMLSYVLGNKLTTAANLIFLQATAPVYLLWLGPVLLGEKVRRSDWWLTAVMAVGMALFFVGVEPGVATAPDPALGNLIGAAAGASWAVTLAGLRWLGRDAITGDHDPAGAAVVAGNLAACALALPFALPLAGVGSGDFAIVGYLGVMQIGVAYLAMTRGVRGVPALEVSLILLVEPVLAAVWAWLLHGERPAGWSLAGCLIILGATVTRTLGGVRLAPNRATG